MATVHGPQVARHPSPFRRAYKPPKPAQPQSHHHSHSSSHSQSTSSHSSTQPDPYYGHEEVAKMCARFVGHIFTCPELPPPPPQTASNSVSPPPVAPTLAHFVAYALHRTRLHHSVTFTALALLQRLKTRFPAARGSSGHRLFLSAFMIASKVVCDDTYSNKSWAVVGQGMFALREINQMEREMCAYLEWHLNVPGEDLEKFEREVRKIYSHPPPYSSHTSLSPLSIAAGPAPEKDREVQQLPTPTDIGLTHTAPWASSSRASMSSFVQPPSPPSKVGISSYASKPAHANYITPPSSPGSPGTPMSTADSSPASSEASLPTPPTTATEHHHQPKIVTAASMHVTHNPHRPHGVQSSISAPVPPFTMDLSMPVGHEKYQLSLAALEAKMAAVSVGTVVKTATAICAW